MKTIFLLVFILGMNFSFSQEIEITVKDHYSKKPIPFATIKYENSNNGTYTDEEGNVSLSMDIEQIEVSCVGYYSKKVDSIESNDAIYLKPQVLELDEIVIASSQKTNTIGKKKRKSYVGYSSNSRSTLFAKRFDFKNSVEILKVHLDMINNGVLNILKLKIYDIDSLGFPGKNILKKHVYDKVKPYQNGVNINLGENSIFLKNKSIFLVIEILDLRADKNNSRLRIGNYKKKVVNYSLSKPVFSKYDKWRSIQTENNKEEYQFNFHLTVNELIP